MELTRKLILGTFLLVLLSVMGASCRRGPAPEVEGGLPDFDPQLALSLVKTEGALLIDVRTPEEFAGERIPGARNFPIQDLPKRLPEIEELAGDDKDKPIVIYCASGFRAAKAKAILLDAGFKRLTNLGGVSDWVGSGSK